MKINIIKKFITRDELDEFVRVNFGRDEKKNRDIVLEMSSEEMKSLSLSEGVNVYGAKVRKEIIK